MADYSKFSDDQLLLALKHGDHRAFTQIYHRYFRLMAIQAEKILQQEEAVYDLLQNIFTDLWERREQLLIHGSLKGYLHTAVRNGALNEIRLSKNHAAKLDLLIHYVLVEEPAADTLVRSKQLTEAINLEVAKLPERTREALQLSRDGGHSHAEIAQKMGISKSTVKTHINNALHQLAEKLSSFFIFLIIYILHR
ncbi:RNA polymerase sigma-70 factor, ECF subfamily [bacterium A37T11]|nr:RNA polymerase sigma-70 factor, ECF subfamily [bacterium A37T11]